MRYARSAPRRRLAEPLRYRFLLAERRDLARESDVDLGLLAGIERLLVRLLDVPAGCVQYHPEAGPGPNDSLALFDDYLAELAGAA